MLINPYSTNVPFLDPLKTSENLYEKKKRNKNFPDICMFTMRGKQITYSDPHHISILRLLNYIGTPLLSKKGYRVRNGKFKVIHCQCQVRNIFHYISPSKCIKHKLKLFFEDFPVFILFKNKIITCLFLFCILAREILVVFSGNHRFLRTVVKTISLLLLFFRNK